MATGNIIQIFNRTSRTLQVRKDGRTFPIPPGYSHITEDVLRFAKEQNPVPGTEDPNTLVFESLISVVAPKGKTQRDSLDEIPEEVLAALAKERIDRTLLDPNRQHGAEVRQTMFPRGRVGIESPTPGMREILNKGD